MNRLPARLLPLSLMTACLLATGIARAEEIFQCTDDTGKVEYKNNGNTKGCKRLSVEPVIVPKLAAPVATKSPNNFPKVDADTQHTRDDERKHILQDELKAQDDRIAGLKAAYNDGHPDREGGERNYQKYLDRVQRMGQELKDAQRDRDAIAKELGNSP